MPQKESDDDNDDDRDDHDDNEDNDDENHGLVMILDFHDKRQVDKMFHLTKRRPKLAKTEERSIFVVTSHCLFRHPFLMGLGGVADKLGPINYCMASNSSCKTNDKQQQDMEKVETTVKKRKLHTGEKQQGKTNKIPEATDKIDQ